MPASQLGELIVIAPPNVPMFD